METMAEGEKLFLVKVGRKDTNGLKNTGLRLPQDGLRVFDGSWDYGDLPYEDVGDANCAVIAQASSKRSSGYRERGLPKRVLSSVPRKAVVCQIGKTGEFLVVAGPPERYGVTVPVILREQLVVETAKIGQRELMPDVLRAGRRSLRAKPVRVRKWSGI